MARPNGLIRFKMLETIKGPLTPSIVLPGRLTDNDMFSPEKPLYTSSAYAGGTCFSSLYRTSGQYLLFLNTNEAGHFTAIGSPSRPSMNNSTRGDPLLQCVREQAHKAFEA